MSFSSAEYLDFTKRLSDPENHFSHDLYVSVLLYNIIIMVFQFCEGAGQSAFQEPRFSLNAGWH
jgi:hypothetical protein